MKQIPTNTQPTPCQINTILPFPSFHQTWVNFHLSKRRKRRDYHSYLLSKPTPPTVTNSLASLGLRKYLLFLLHPPLREAMERFSVLPFSIGCVSHSSVDVIKNQSKKTQREPNPSTPACGDREEKLSSKANISGKLQKLMKGFKSLPHAMFQVYREEEDDEVEMEIAFPTDVQHVGHIGLDGSNNNSFSNVSTWDKATELMSFPSLSLRKFELAVAREDSASI